jgi:hypothetical protein
MMELPTNGFFNQVDAFNSLAMSKEPGEDGNVCAFT